jgi:RNA polymerase sigma-70 factor (ECF subfamily)
MEERILIEVKPGAEPEDEAAAVREAQNSLAGFKQLYLRWLSPVYRYFYFRTGNVKDAEDLTSQVFLKVYEELPRYRNQGRFPAWLFTIARNKAIDFSRSRPQEEPIEIVDPVDGSLDLLAQAIQSDEIRRLNRLIHSLPDDEQELIRLRFVGGLGYREIGEMLHRKEDAVRKSISRLLTRLQTVLSDGEQMEKRHG